MDRGTTMTVVNISSNGLSCRAVCGGVCFLLAGCLTAPQRLLSGGPQGNDLYASIYTPVMDGSFAIRALEIDLAVNQDLLRREVAFPRGIVREP